MFEYTVRKLSLDANEFVLSDGLPDRMGDVIEPSAWQIGKFSPVALFNHDRDAIIGKWDKVRVEGGKLLKGALVFAEKGTSAVVDTVRALMEQGLLESVSVGFRSLEREPLDPKDPWGPQRFTKVELLEASLVAIPANPRAHRIAKHFLSEDQYRRLCAEPGVIRARDPSERQTRQAAENQTVSSKGKTMKISEQITAKTNAIVSVKDKVAAIARRAEETGTVSDDDAAALAALKGELEGLEKDLVRLKSVEEMLMGGQASGPVIEHDPNEAGRVVAPALAAPATIKPPIKVKGWDPLLRSVLVSVRAHHQRRNPLEVLRESYKDDRDLELFLKTTTAPAITNVTGWAAELVQQVLGAFMETLATVAVYPSVAALGLGVTFDGLAPIRIPYRKYGSGTANAGVPSGTANNRRLAGGFVKEGDPIPVRQALFASLILNAFKMGVISVFTQEMANTSSPSIEGIIRDAMLEDTSWALDYAFLSTDAAVTDTRPAGILNGVSAITATAAGSTAALTDVLLLLNAIYGAGGGRSLVWLMNPAQDAALDLTVNSGQFIFQTVKGKSWFANRVVSTHIPARTVILLDAADFVSGTGAPTFNVSDQATLHMDDGTYADNEVPTSVKPLVGAASPPPALADIATPMRSLYQTASIAVRMTMPTSWAMRRTGMIAWMQNVNW